MEPRSPTHLEELIAQAAGLRRLAVRLVGESDADDVLQEAVTAGIQHAPGNPRELRPWLAQVVRNFAAGRHRGEGRRKAREVDVARREALPSASDLVERMEVQRIVAEEVLRLDEPYRATVLALHFEGLGAEEYARSLCVPSATVRSWSKRGLDALRTRLDKRFGGDRKAWSACLLPLARPEGVATALVVGGSLMIKKVIAACVVLALALSLTLLWSPGTETMISAPEPSRPVVLAEVPATGSAAIPAVASVSKPDEAESERVAFVAHARPASVTGRVSWKPDGAPAVDIGVRLISGIDRDDGAPPQCLTDREGRFRLESVAPGFYQLHLDRAGVKRSFAVQAGASVEVMLEMARGEGVVGRVLDPEGQPVAGAEIHMRESNSTWTRFVTFAGADGSYRIEGADNWTCLFARAPGRAPSGLRQTMGNGGRPIDLYLGGVPGRITGHVQDRSGVPQPGALVEITWAGGNGIDPVGERVMSGSGRELRTDAQGDFVVQDAEPGPNTVRVRALGHPWIQTEVDVRPGLASHVVIELLPTARVLGRVTDAAGVALEAARIEVRSAERAAWASVDSDPEGRFDLGVPAGRVRLVARHSDGVEAALDVDLAPGAEFAWSPSIGAFRSIRGRLVDVAGLPLVGRTVKLSAKQRTARTDDEGRFVFETLKPQEYGLSFTEGQLTARATGVPGDENVVLVAEHHSARIVGRILDAEGQPREDARLECDRAIVTSGPDGAFEFANMRSGQHAIEIRDVGLVGLALATVDVRPGQLHDAGTLVMPGVGSLSVLVRSDEGVPIGWTSPVVRRIGEGGGWLSARGWNARGIWAVDNLPAGDYEICVPDGSAAMETRTFSIRADEETKLELNLRFGTSVEIEVGVASGGVPVHALEFEFLGSDGARVGRESLSNAWGLTSTRVSMTFVPGDYECVVRSKDGRSGRARLHAPPFGGQSEIVRIELR